MGPTDYRITVRGEMGDRLARAFAPLAVRSHDGRTVIEGDVGDQSHLFGILQRVRDLGIDLIEVAPVGGAGRAHIDDTGGSRR
jgi:hypothetical protein